MKIQRWVTKFWYASTEEGLEYRKFNREVRRKMKAAKEEWIEEQWKSIEKGMMLGTIPSRLSARANSISQQSSKTAAETS